MRLFSEINTSDADAHIQKHTKNCTTSFLFLDLWHTWVQYITKFARSPELYFFFRRHRVVTNTLKFVPLVPLNNIWLGLLAFVPKTRGPSKHKSILSMCCGEHLVNKINQLKSKIYISRSNFTPTCHPSKPVALAFVSQGSQAFTLSWHIRDMSDWKEKNNGTCKAKPTHLKVPLSLRLFPFPV